MKLSDAAREVIALAGAIRDYWATELPKRHPRYPLVQAGEDSGPPPEEARLRDLLAHLTAEQVYQFALISCTWAEATSPRPSLPTPIRR